MQNTCHPSFQDGLTNILAQTSCHKQIRAFVCDVRGCNFETARQLQRRKWMLTTILRRCINYGSACLRATSRRLRSRMIRCHSERKRGNPAKRNVTDVQISRLNIVDKGHAQTNKIGCGCSRHQLLINNYSLLISKEDCL